MMEKKDLSIKHIRIILKEILIPKPDPKDMFNIKRSQVERVLKEFGKFMEKESAEFKKKRSY